MTTHLAERAATIPTLSERLEAARELAHNGGIPVRRKDGSLYAIFAECLSICEMVAKGGSRDELRQAVRVKVDKINRENWGRGLPRSAGNAGRGKRYAERASDEYVLVCRYVFESDHRGNFYRYASTLREAGKRQIRSGDLSQWLAENGGVNTLFMGRGTLAALRAIRTLHLNAPVECPKVGAFTLTLRMDHRGFFDVLSEGGKR
jgi:hypothetical protein